MASITGNNIKLSLFGESHGELIGITLDGLKAGIKLDFDYIERELVKRRPYGAISTKRVENDEMEVVSGYFNGYTTGTPLTILVRNKDIKPEDYKPNILRPGHADYTGFLKYDGYQDFRGGGHFSGRMTVGIVIAGAICKQILENKGILIGSHLKQVYDVVDVNFSVNKQELLNQIDKLNKQKFATISKAVGDNMQEVIKCAKENDDSVGGIIESAIVNMEGGIGEPFFDSIESKLSSLIFSIPGVKGIEFGKGFEFANMLGSEANDPFIFQDGIKTTSNNNGGINGGISNGMPIVIKTVVKPTPSIGVMQNTVDLLKNQNTTLKIKGRHDPCIVHRARVVVDSMIAIGLLDLYVARFGYEWM